MTDVLWLPGGSFTWQLNPTGLPPEVYQALQNLKQSLDRWTQQVGRAVNTNQCLLTQTGQRPTAFQLSKLPNQGVGYMMFDISQNRPIWYAASGATGWLNADGNPI